MAFPGQRHDIFFETKNRRVLHSYMNIAILVNNQLEYKNLKETCFNKLQENVHLFISNNFPD